MNAKTLLDSRRFHTLMDDLARDWRKRGATDEDRAFRLQAVLDFLGGEAVPPAPVSVHVTPSREELKEAVVVDPPSQPKPADAYSATLEWANEKAAEIVKLPAVDPSGLRLVSMPTGLDPNILHLVCDKERSLPFCVDTTGAMITMAGGMWQVPVMLR